MDNYENTFTVTTQPYDIKIVDSLGNDVEYTHFTFSGGEEQVRIEPFDVNACTIHAKQLTSVGIAVLELLTNALYYMDKKVTIFMPYLPYARQDRVCSPGEANALKSFLSKFTVEELVAVDVHNPSAAKQVLNIPFSKNLIWELEQQHFDVLVAPDKGARGRCEVIAKELGISFVIMAEKVRNPDTGVIEKTVVSEEDLALLDEKRVLIYDDICDGGRTFIELAKVLKLGNPYAISLAVTHGIFSKGMEPIMEDIDYVYTTDSICHFEHDFLTVVPV